MAQGELDQSGLDQKDLAMLAYAEKLTREPSKTTDADTDELRALGFDDAQLWEATFTASIFNLFTRMADAFGIIPRKNWHQRDI